jgi:hypothetical protein
MPVIVPLPAVAAVAVLDDITKPQIKVVRLGCAGSVAVTAPVVPVPVAWIENIFGPP